MVKDLQSLESKEKDGQEDVYSGDAAGGPETHRLFIASRGSFVVSLMGSGASGGVEKLVSVNFRRLREGWEALDTHESY